MGNAQDARKIVATLDRTNALLARMDGMAAKADQQVFGPAEYCPRCRPPWHNWVDCWPIPVPA